MDMTNLPEALKQQMGDHNPDKAYTKRDYVLSYIVRNGEAVVDELLVYLWHMTGEVTSRSYLHGMLKSLRDDDRIESTQFGQGKSSTYRATSAGEDKARPFKGVNV